jgi:hypothetical protein
VDLYRISLRHVAEGGTLAEEVISTVRTAQAVGAQKFLSNMYDEHIEVPVGLNPGPPFGKVQDSEPSFLSSTARTLSPLTSALPSSMKG